MCVGGDARLLGTGVSFQLNRGHRRANEFFLRA